MQREQIQYGDLDKKYVLDPYKEDDLAIQS